jgi:ankyrin repeat protein
MKSLNLILSVVFMSSLAFAKSTDVQRQLLETCSQKTFNTSVQAQLDSLLKQGAALNKPYTGQINSDLGPITISDFCMNATVLKGNVGLLKYVIEKGARVLAANSQESLSQGPVLVTTPFDQVGEYYMNAGGWSDNLEARETAAGLVNVLVPAFVREAKQGGLSVDTPVAEVHTPALNIAALYGADAAVNALLSAGAKIEVTDGDERTPLINALINNQTSTVVLLTGHGANVQCVGLRCPLFQAAAGGVVEIVQNLLDHHADVLALTNAGHNVLYDVGYSRKPTLALLKTLVSAHADVNAPYIDRITGGSSNGQIRGFITPIISVIMGRAEDAERTAMIGYLLENHANPSSGCDYNLTPVGLAKNYGLNDVLKLLVQAGADANLTTCSVK